MLRFVLLSLAVACTNAIVCMPDMCQTVRCAAVTAENCVGGNIVPNGGFCGCCDACVIQLAAGDSCIGDLLMGGMPSHSHCGEGLYCDPNTVTCVKTVTKKQVLLQTQTAVSCAQRLLEIQQAQQNGMPLLGQFIPQCDVDGSYSARQCHGSECYCVDPTGHKIQGYTGSIGDATMDCKCARDLYQYMQSGLIGKLFNCASNGSYQRYACSGSVCFCADSNGNLKLGSPTVNIGNIGSLQC